MKGIKKIEIYLIIINFIMIFLLFFNQELLIWAVIPYMFLTFGFLAIRLFATQYVISDEIVV